MICVFVLCTCKNKFSPDPAKYNLREKGAILLKFKLETRALAVKIKGAGYTALLLLTRQKAARLF